MSESTKQRIRETTILQWQNASYRELMTTQMIGNKRAVGCQRSDACKQKIAEKLRGRKRPEQVRINSQIATLKAMQRPEVRAKIAVPYNKGKACPEEVKAKISAANKGVPKPLDFSEKIKASWERRKERALS